MNTRVIAFALAVASCGESTNDCRLDVRPRVLNFGTVEPNRTVSRALSLENLSSEASCVVGPTEIVAGSGPAFEGLVGSEDGPSTIPPNTAISIPVAITPRSPGPSDALLRISTNDPLRPTVEIGLLAGVSDAPGLLIAPDVVNFGEVDVSGCESRRRTVNIINVGGFEEEITRVELDAPGGVFTLTSTFTLPLRLRPGASAVLELAFAPPTLAVFGGELRIGSENDAGEQSAAVLLTGAAFLGRGRQRDRFEVLGPPKSDVLFVLDTGSSMSARAPSISANILDFVQFKEAQGHDYHLGVISSSVAAEGGVLRPMEGPKADRVVRSDAGSPTEAMLAKVAPRSSVHGENRLFEATVAALTPPNLLGANSDFMRSDAPLSIIAITDRAEASDLTLDLALNVFLSIKGFRNTQLFSFSAVSGGEQGCESNDDFAAPSPRLVEIANRTGGIVESICREDWSRSFEDLGRTSWPLQSRFFLTNQPIISTIQVFVGELEVPEHGEDGRQNWRFDFSTNAVSFSPRSLPEAGSKIEITYAAECL